MLSLMPLSSKTVSGPLVNLSELSCLGATSSPLSSHTGEKNGLCARFKLTTRSFHFVTPSFGAGQHPPPQLQA